MITIFEKLNRYFQANWNLAVLDLKKGLWTLKPTPAVIPYLKAENAKGRHILIQPRTHQPISWRMICRTPCFAPITNIPMALLNQGDWSLKPFPSTSMFGSIASILSLSIKKDSFFINSKVIRRPTPTTASEDALAFKTEKKNTKLSKASFLWLNSYGSTGNIKP